MASSTYVRRRSPLGHILHNILLRVCCECCQEAIPPGTDYALVYEQPALKGRGGSPKALRPDRCSPSHIVCLPCEASVGDYWLPKTPVT